MGDLMEMNPPEQDQRYAVYSVRNTAEDGLIYTRSFIVIKNGYGVIVRFTRLQEYGHTGRSHRIRRQSCTSYAAC